MLLVCLCVTTKEKLEMEDTGDSGGILLKSNTEAPGEEVVKGCARSDAPAAPAFLFVLFIGP